MTLLDARGVTVEVGDTVIYGFGVGSSVAMAEGVVLGETNHLDNHEFEDCPGCTGGIDLRVSQTPSGLVRIRVIRRSYSSGIKPVITIAADRFVVLKTANTTWNGDDMTALLPASPLPTQDDVALDSIRKSIERNEESLRATETPEWWNDGPYESPELSLAHYHEMAAHLLESNRKALERLEEEIRDSYNR